MKIWFPPRESPPKEAADRMTSVAALMVPCLRMSCPCSSLNSTVPLCLYYEIPKWVNAGISSPVPSPQLFSFYCLVRF